MKSTTKIDLPEGAESHHPSFRSGMASPPAHSWDIRFRVWIKKVLGTLLAVNFLCLWAAPIIIQGQLYRRGVDRLVRPIYCLVDSPALRRFASRHIYREAARVDYIAAAVLLLVSMSVILGVLFAWQIMFGTLPWWLIAVYYFIWAGPGGRSMGTAWTIAHREGHRPRGKLYQPWLGNRVGNFFENWLGVFYGTVPYIFSISHTLTHHRFNAGKGDPVYLWDIDRTRFGDLMLYQWRIFLYMTGISTLTEFSRESGVLPAVDRGRSTLRRGMAIYWICVPMSILALLIALGSSITSALLFLFFIYLQPLFAMSSFLSLISIGQHGFLEFDESAQLMKHVTSTTIIDGFDDSYGEDYHLLHHFYPEKAHDQVEQHVLSERSQWASCAGSVFKRTTFIEIALMIQFGQFDQLIRNHYVHFNDEHTIEELITLFEIRAKRKEMTYEEYEYDYLPNLRQRVGMLVKQGVCKNEPQGYIYQAHHILQSSS